MKYDTLIVDSPYLSHKSFATKFQLKTSTGLNSTLFHNFIRTVGSLKKQFQPDEIIFTWESHGSPSWRKQLYPNYKPQNWVNYNYVNDVKQIQVFLLLLGYTQYYAPNNEADDVIATLCEKNPTPNNLIYTVDKDLYQLIDGNVYVFNDKDKHIYNDKMVFEKFGVYPNQIPDLLAVWGDTSDNIEGIEGFGFVKSSNLISKYGSIEKIPSSEPIFKFMSQLKLNKTVATLNRECTLVEYNPMTFETLDGLLNKYELNQIKNNIGLYKAEAK